MEILLFLLLTSPADYTAHEYQPSPVEKKVVEFTGTTQNADSVIAFIKTGLKTDSLNVMLHRRYQDARMRAEKDRSALVHDYETFLETHPRSPAFLYLLGRIQTDTAKEKNYYQQAYKADSNNYWANYGLGAFSLLKEKNFEVAKKFLDRVIAIDNSIYLPFYLYANNGDPASKEQFLSLALVCDPTNTMLLGELGITAASTKDYTFAIDRINQTLARKNGLSPQVAAAAYGELLNLYLKKKEFDRAQAYIDSVKALAPQTQLDWAYIELYANKTRPDSLLFYLKRWEKKFHTRSVYNWLQALQTETPVVMKNKNLIAYLKETRQKLGLDLPAKAIAGTTADGREISLPQFKGKIVLVDFWASWCGPCRGETPYLIGVYKKYHGKGLEIIGVNIDTDQTAMAGYLKENPDMVWPQIFSGKAWQDENAVRYEVKAIPQIMLIDKKGIVREIDLRGEGIEIAVSKLLE
jgi:thiol-disulfide isomerase/thioredoxin